MHTHSSPECVYCICTRTPHRPHVRRATPPTYTMHARTLHSQLDDALLLELGTGCPGLQRLHLQHCELISERGAFYVATSCRNLRELRLCGCAQLTDDQALQATHGCSSLQLLELPSGKLADVPPE